MFNNLKVAFFLTGKNLWRGNKGVTILIIFLLILVCVNLLFPPALLKSLIEVVNIKLINTQSGDLIVEPSNGLALLENVEELISEIEDIDGVQAATWRTSIGAQLEAGSYISTFGVSVIDPDQYQEVFDLPEYMAEGKFLEADNLDDIMLGVQVAGMNNEDLELYTSSLRNVHAGDKITVSYSGLLEKEYEVDGIFDTKFVLTDIASFITADEYFELQPDKKDTASTVHIRLEEGADREKIADQITDLNDDITIKNWEETAGLLKSVTDTFEITTVILQVIALLVAAIAIFIVTYVDLVNKRRQIGIQRAIGITSSAIMVSYIFRAVVYSIIGIALGVLVFAYVIIPIEHKYPFEFPFGYAHFTFSLRESIDLFIALVIVGIVAAVVPTARTLHKKILDAIWG